MIKAIVERNEAGEIAGFTLTGHAGYAPEGEDIVCAAVSMLAINAVNSVEKFTGAKCETEGDEQEGGRLSFHVQEVHSPMERHDVSLLLRSLLFGLRCVEMAYEGTIEIFDEGGRKE